MPDAADVSEATTQGEPMTHDDDESTTDGEPMTDATDLPNEPTHQGDAMPDPTDLPTEPTTDGEPMTKPTHPFPRSTTHEEPMPHAPDLPTESPSHGEPMTHDEGEDDTLPGFPPQDFARAELSGIARALGHDEVRVLTRIAVRLRDGRKVYGPLDLARDTREFRAKEAREELEDALVYLACAWLKTATHLEVNR